MKCVILVGDTRTGKSSALKDLTGDPSIVCGKGNLGSSTTTKIQIYKPQSPQLSPYIFMDTVGRGDNSLQITPDQIREQIQLTILSLPNNLQCDSIQGIVVTESLRGDSYRLPNTLKFITEIFGDLPSKSILILGTKAHRQDQDEVMQRQREIHRIMKQFSIPLTRYRRFDTSYDKLSQAQISPDQYSWLQANLKECQMMNANSSIERKRAMIKDMALSIQKEKTEVKHHPYTHYWTERVFNGTWGRMTGGKKDVQRSETRYNTTTHVPQYEYCYGLALKKYENQVRQRLRQQL